MAGLKLCRISSFSGHFLAGFSTMSTRLIMIIGLWSMGVSSFLGSMLATQHFCPGNQLLITDLWGKHSLSLKKLIMIMKSFGLKRAVIVALMLIRFQTKRSSVFCQASQTGMFIMIGRNKQKDSSKCTQDGLLEKQQTFLTALSTPRWAGKGHFLTLTTLCQNKFRLQILRITSTSRICNMNFQLKICMSTSR
jgi:hypothetical protein